MAEDKKKWYVLRTISQKELKVKEMLDNACKHDPFMREHLFKVLVPTEKKYVSRGGKKVIKDSVLFPGYVYILAHLEGEMEDFVRNTTNVIDFVRSREVGHKPEPIREAEIKRMLGAVEEEGVAAVAAANDFIVGEIVKVNSGPFSGFTGEIEEVNPEKHKLTVMVKVFGRKTPLELENSEVVRE